jgi:ATP-dependent DNA ligase
VALPTLIAYIPAMVWRVRGRPFNSPASFIHPCQPTVASKPPTRPGWAQGLKHDGYRLQIHVRDGRVRLYTMNGADRSALRKLLRGDRGIQYVEHAEGYGDKLYAAACRVGLEGIISKMLDAPYRSGKSKAWIMVKNPNAPTATRAADGTF